MGRMTIWFKLFCNMFTIAGVGSIMFCFNLVFMLAYVNPNKISCIDINSYGEAHAELIILGAISLLILKLIFDLVKDYFRLIDELNE